MASFEDRLETSKGTGTSYDAGQLRRNWTKGSSEVAERRGRDSTKDVTISSRKGSTHEEENDNGTEEKTVVNNAEPLKFTEVDANTSAAKAPSNDLQQRSGSALLSISSSGSPIDTVCPWEKFENMQYYTKPSNATYDIPADFLEFQKAKSLIDKPCKWKECIYTDGSKFWCDGCRAVREKPQEVEEYEKAEALVARGTNWKVRDSGVYFSNGVMSVWKEPPELADYQDKLARFKELLREKKITSRTEWADIVRLCSTDARWDLLSEAFRKTWIIDLQNNRNSAAGREQQEKDAKQAFLEMLGTYYIDESTSWPDISEKICDTARGKAVKHEHLMWSYFQEFKEGLYQRNRQYKDDRLAPARKRFTELLEGGSVPIGVKTCWTDVEMPLDEMCDVNPIFEELDLAERQRLLERYVRRLRYEEESARLAIEILEKQDRKEITDEILDKFEVFVREQVDAGVLNAKSWWYGEFEETVKHEDYYSVMQNLCDDPYALEGRFWDVIQPLALKEQQEKYPYGSEAWQHDNGINVPVRSLSQERGERPIAVAGGTGLYVYVSEEDRKKEKPTVVFKKKVGSSEKVKRNIKKPERDYGGEGSDEEQAPASGTAVKRASKPAPVPKAKSSVVICPRQYT